MCEKGRGVAKGGRPGDGPRVPRQCETDHGSYSHVFTELVSLYRD